MMNEVRLISPALEYDPLIDHLPDRPCTGRVHPSITGRRAPMEQPTGSPRSKPLPWITAPGECEPGAQRWCHYYSNAFGDPALEIRIEKLSVFTILTWNGSIDAGWDNPNNWTPAIVPTSLYDVVIPNTPVKPVITSETASCSRPYHS